VSASRRPGPSLAALGVLFALLLTVDVRGFGLIPDGKEMLSAGAAIARFLEIGISRDFVNAPRRPAGDAVSRYGMGLSLVEALPAAVSRAAGLARTAPLFVLVPILCLAGCAWAAARATGTLGAGAGAAALSGAGLVLATPLWGYAASDYGEPLQALCVALTVLGAVELRADAASRRWQILLGVAAGWAILTKTLLVLVAAPLLVCVLAGRREKEKEEKRDSLEEKRAEDTGDSKHVAPRRESEGPGRGRAARAERRAARARCRTRQAAARSSRVASAWPLLFSFAGILFLWFLFEIARFGKLGGGYAGETFTYPFFTGLLRLTVLPNKGLLWYAPVTFLAVPGFLALRRRDSRLALALAASFLALLFASSAWWAWDGQAGWGPRLVLPALPCLLVLAGLGLAEGARAWRVAGALAIAAGAGINALGALVPFPAVYALAGEVPPQPISASRAAGTQYEVAPGGDGVLRATGPHHLSLTPAWSPIRVHALVLAARLKGGWDGSLPELDPPFGPVLPPSPAPALRLALSPVRAGWGRDFFERARADGNAGSESWADPYFDALTDQMVRAIDVKDYGRALTLGEELTAREEKISSNDPRTVALVAESLRLGGPPPARGTGTEAPTPSSSPSAPSASSASLSYLSRKPLSSSSSSSSLYCHPWILFVRAMAEPPGDFSCLPESQREGFARGVEIARRRGWTLTEWSRAATTGRP